MARLILISNRLPVTVEVERGKVSVIPSAGGLATAADWVPKDSFRQITA